ncbi:MAG: flagellar hook protein FlgE [Synergistaceae bacterium]|nr:flagellar hook protein FlgE [Synergistaceae bacterium]
MLRSLMSGVSGVRGHQTLLDVVGNNIANVNTVGFKKSNVTFQDLMYQTSKGASAPGEARGGINPMQVGLGVNVAAIETIHSQGQLQFTGNRTDMAVEGDGYYVVSDGTNQLYTRAGNFILDANGNLVQSGTGYMVKGFGMSVNPIDPSSYTMGSNLMDINIPVGQKIPAKATELAGFRCNLDSRVDAYLPMGIETNDSSLTVNLGTDRYVLSNISGNSTQAGFLTLSTAAGATFPAGIVCAYDGIDTTSGYPLLDVTLTGAFADPTNPLTTDYDSSTGTLTLLNSSNQIVSKIELSGFMNIQMVTDSSSGTAVNYLVEFDDDAATGNRILNLWSETAADPETLEIPMNSDGTFQLAAATAIGGSPLSARATENGLGVTLLNGGVSVATLNQKIAGVHNTKLDVYDSLGNAHTLEVSWEKIDNNQWRWRAWLPSEPGITISNNTGIMEFNSDGKITAGSSGVIGLNFASLGAEDAAITLDFTGEAFGKDVMEGVTQYGSAYTTKGYFQDGYAMGILNDFAAGKDGTITGVYSNGVTIPLYRIALAQFSNPTGLSKVGSTAFASSNNSGLAQIVAAGEGGAGTIAGGTLEMANVDLSEEFVRLIIAQRGFQANARVVTTSDQVLEEVINIKR